MPSNPCCTQVELSQSAIQRAMDVLLDRIGRLDVTVSEMEKKCASVMRCVPESPQNDKVPCSAANVSALTAQLNVAASRIMEVTARVEAMLEASEL